MLRKFIGMRFNGIYKNGMPKQSRYCHTSNKKNQSYPIKYFIGDFIMITFWGPIFGIGIAIPFIVLHQWYDNYNNKEKIQE